MKLRKKKYYFERVDGAPEPVVVELKRRARFSEVDVMGVVWHGRYSLYFEEVSEEIGRRCGMSYKDFYEAGLRTPIVEFHINYYKPLYLDEEFTIRGTLLWHDGPRLNIEYQLLKQDGNCAASGYTVQLFIYSGSWEVCIVSPGLLERCRKRWKAGEFH
ncbi:MAG: acyl-CoA thioesterase [Thermodesulfovibrionales bacterium]|nr:acyl-CoA thioesterase [Thermodesulfovibrionales bacterium]